MQENTNLFYDNHAQSPFEFHDQIGQGLGVVQEVVGKKGYKDFEDRIYARKIINIPKEEGKDRQDTLGAIRNEVKNLQDAQHIHTVKLIMDYETKTNYAIVMDPRADGNLEEFFINNPRQAQDEIPMWFGCLLNALSFLHEKRIKHRDIKPQNLLVKDKNILITDFGISLRSLGRTMPTTLPNRSPARTREYCSPDVENGHTRGSPADVFALGAVFLEMLTVCAFSDPIEKIEALREQLKTADNGFSFARGVNNLGDWMDFIEASPSRLPWHDTILRGCCEPMLQEERENRPTANDLYSNWKLTHVSKLPQSDCNCHKA